MFIVVTTETRGGQLITIFLNFLTGVRGNANFVAYPLKCTVFCNSLVLTACKIYHSLTIYNLSFESYFVLFNISVFLLLFPSFPEEDSMSWQSLLGQVLYQWPHCVLKYIAVYQSAVQWHAVQPGAVPLCTQCSIVLYLRGWRRQTDTQTDRQTDMATLWPTQPSGAKLVKLQNCLGKPFFFKWSKTFH